jgi:chromosome partitioning protein
MRTFALVCQKGGAGKATLAIHLAAEAAAHWLRTLLSDLDPQASAARWADRPQPGSLDVDVAVDSRARREAAVRQAEREAYDVDLLDTAPHADQAALRVARLSDLVLVPVRCSILDLDAVGASLASAFWPAVQRWSSSMPPRSAPRVVKDRTPILRPRLSGSGWHYCMPWSMAGWRWSSNRAAPPRPRSRRSTWKHANAQTCTHGECLMARRPSLSEAGVTRPSRATPPAALPSTPADARRSPARQGKKAVAFWVDPGASDQLRIASINQRRSIQQIMEEALDDWFEKHGLPRLSASTVNGKAA